MIDKNLEKILFFWFDYSVKKMVDFWFLPYSMIGKE
jgi:hypothetical protein